MLDIREDKIKEARSQIKNSKAVGEGSTVSSKVGKVSFSLQKKSK